MPPALGPVIDDALTAAADPFAARRALERLAERRPEITALDPEASAALVAVAGASPALLRRVESDPRALGVLSALDRPTDVPVTSPPALRRWKDLELLRIAARDLRGLDDLPSTTRRLSDLAGTVIGTAVELHARTDASLAVVGMGKLGGRELNYASDVDVLFVGDGRPEALERLARLVMDTVRPCFRIDVDLRPEGRAGQLVRSVDGYESYWDRWARPWEFQALLKARPVAGDPRLGARFADTAQRWLWNRPVATDDLREVRHLKERTEARVDARGEAERDVKLGPGGIRDIEFAVQLLQLVHGQLDAGLRSPTTLVALDDLASAGYVSPDDASVLREAYVELRVIEHRLQLVEERQTHLLPRDPSARTTLARVLGYRDRPDGGAGEVFERALRHRRVQVRGIYERLWFRPLLEAFATRDALLSESAVQTRLSAFGFTDAERTRAAVHELTRGMTRTSRLMQQFLPLVLDWLSASPDPDLGLLMLCNVLTGPRTAIVADAFRDSPEAARRLCSLLGTSRFLGEAIARNPDLVAGLPDPVRGVAASRSSLVESATAAVAWRDDPLDRQRALGRWKERAIVGIAAGDVLDGADVTEVGAHLTAVAEAILEVALTLARPGVPVAVIGLGRFGGSALGYPSDLDLVVVFDGEGGDDAAEATRVAQDLLRMVGGAGADRVFSVDTDLRPEGRHGPLARSVASYAAYFERWAEPWERQAYLRARPVAGDPALGARLLEAIAPAVWRPLTDADAREIRRMKARIERERIPSGEDPQFHLKLGRGSLSDVEFTAQLLQLRHGVRTPDTLTALDRLAHLGALDGDDAAALAEAYRFCEATRNRLFLVESAATDALPTVPEHLSWLARSLGTSPAALRERYRRVTRRARRVTERVFYERTLLD